MKSLLILAFLIYSAISMGCEVHVPANLLVIGENNDFASAMAQTNCSDETIKEINSILNGVNGKITSFQFAEMLRSKNLQAEIQPQMIQVQHLKNVIREQIMLPTGVAMKSAQAMNAQNFISLNQGDKVEVECVGCLFGAQQPINVRIRGFDGTTKTLSVTADFKKMVKAYRFTSFLPAFSEVPAHALKEEFIESVPHTDLITSLDELKFYKLNKPVRAGELLRKQDLNALSLVKAGMKTEVIIENELVRLKTDGISRSNGSLGEMVEVYHPQKNKKYLGKVIDINKVQVEL